MNKRTRQSLIIFLIAIVILCSVSICGYAMYARADQKNDDSKMNTRGIFTSLSVTIKTDESDVMLVVKNDITIFSSTVKVRATLYSSLYYTENYEEMTIENYAYTLDLDMGNSLTAKASTGGETKYWLGRVQYKVDNDSWVTTTTTVYKISGSGEYLE